MAPGSRFTAIALDPFSKYEVNNLEVSNDLPAPAVPATKIAFTHRQNEFSHNNLDLF